jgi:preprotein translocase subunit SecG
MGFVIGLLTLVMVVDCIALVLLVLIQLPKKEAGAGLAFGGAATDALFGAGSGTVLTRITKYAAGIFFVLAIVLAQLQSYYHRRTSSEFRNLLSQPSKLPLAAPAAPAPTAPAAPANAPTAPVVSSTNKLMSAQPAAEATNQPAPANTAPTNTAPATSGKK